MYVRMILGDQLSGMAQPKYTLWAEDEYITLAVWRLGKSNYSVRQTQHKNRKCKNEAETSHAYSNSVKGEEITKCAVI